ncbi:MAG: Dabb family protein [Candidatus Nanopelagicales bacterium]
MITHSVLFQLHEPADADEVVRRLEGLRGRIPTLRSLTAGVDVGHDPAGFHVALVTTHDDLEGLVAYAEDPLHREFGAWLAPRMAARAAVDFEAGA